MTNNVVSSVFAMFVMFYQTRMVYFLFISPYSPGQFVYSKDPDKTRSEGHNKPSGGRGAGVGGDFRRHDTRGINMA